MGLKLRTQLIDTNPPGLNIKPSALTYAEGDSNFIYLLTNMSGSSISITGPTTVTGNLSVNGTLSLTSNFLGTSSWADNVVNATTSSYITSSFFTGTNAALSSSYATTASYVSLNFQNEIHVSQVDGNDTTGDGSLLKPVATITKALTLLMGSRKTIIVHPGEYKENVTVASGNTTISTTELTGANTLLSGSLTIGTLGSGCRISGLKMSNLVISGTAQAYISNCTIDNNVTKSSSGYVEIINTEMQCIAGIQISGSGITIINGNKNVGVSVSNASAQVIIKGCNSVVTPSASAGNLAIVDCIVTALGGNAITITGVSTKLTLANSQVLVEAGNNVAPISVAGIYSIFNTVYDKPSSTFTGTSTNSVDYFQYIDADNITTKGVTISGSLTISGSSTFTNIGPAVFSGSVISTQGFSGSFSGSLTGSATTASYVSGSVFTSTNPALSASYALTASYALNGGNQNSIDTSKFITTGAIDTRQYISGSLTIQQNLSVLGSSSFVYVTASQVYLNNNTLTVFGNHDVSVTKAGFIAADSASSPYPSSSLLYYLGAGTTGYWIIDAPLSSSAFTGSLFGTASYAKTASYALNGGGGGGGFYIATGSVSASVNVGTTGSIFTLTSGSTPITLMSFNNSGSGTSSLTLISNDYSGLKIARNSPNDLTWFQVTGSYDANTVGIQTENKTWMSYLRNSRNLYLNDFAASDLSDPGGGATPYTSSISRNLIVYNNTISSSLEFWTTTTGVNSPKAIIKGISGTGDRGGDLSISVNSGSTGITGYAGLVEAMRIKQDGKIGIGTKSPTAVLHISSSGTDSTTTLLRVDNGNATTSSFYVKADRTVGIPGGILYYGPETSILAPPLRIIQSSTYNTYAGIEIGYSNSSLTTTPLVAGSTVIGYNNSYKNGSQIIIGQSNNTDTATSTGTSIILGNNNKITGSNSTGGTIVIGNNNTADQPTLGINAAIIIGQSNNTNGYYGAGLIGSNLKYYGNQQLAFGGNRSEVDYSVKEVWFGYGVMNENNATNTNQGSGPNVSINVSRAYSGSDINSGWPNTNKSGGSLTLNGGQGTGIGSAGDVIIGTPTTGSTGTTFHTPTNRVWVKGHTGYVGIGVSSPLTTLHVSGSGLFTSAVTSSTMIISSSRDSIVTIVGSGSANPLFTVNGSQGQLFSITDSLSGSLFSVNDVSGLSILEVFSDQTTLIGSNLAPALYTTTKVTANTGVTKIYTLPTSSYDGVYVDYTIRSGSNARAGQLIAMWSGSSMNYTEVSASQFGTTTTQFKFGFNVSSSYMLLSGSATSDGWTVKTIIRSI